MRLLSNVPALKPFQSLVTTGFDDLDGLRLKPDHRDHQQRRLGVENIWVGSGTSPFVRIGCCATLGLLIKYIW